MDRTRRRARRRARRYLVTSALAAANTAFGLKPFRTPGASYGLTWAAPWLTSELPMAYLTGRAALAAVMLRGGVLRTRAGRAGLALDVASAAGLLELQRRGKTSGGAVEAALVDGLGPDYRSRIRQPEVPDEPEAATARTPGVLRMLRVRSQFAHDKDIRYGPHGKRNELDIWRRPDLPAGAAAPVLIQVPGGAWTYGNKQGQAYPLMSHLAENGWVCVSISYRLSPRSAWPDHIVDVKRAIAWVKEHIADYGGDPRFVAITGGSAGGHLAALAALSPGDPAFQPGFEDADTSVAAAVPFYGVYDWTPDGPGADMQDFFLRAGIMEKPYAQAQELYRQASPVHRVGPHAPPFFVLHGTHDTLVPIEHARLLVGALRKGSKQAVAYAEVPGGEHAFDVFGSPRATASAEAAARFLGVVYGDWLRGWEAPAAG
jgi:acetyl esterase/lipase